MATTIEDAVGSLSRSSGCHGIFEGDECSEVDHLVLPTDVGAPLARGSMPTDTDHAARVGRVTCWSALRPLICGLLQGGRPTTVARFIESVVIYPIDRVFGARTRPHIRIEGHEGYAPALTDLNPATSIVSIRSVVGIQTASLHSAPSAVLGRSSHAVRTCRRAVLALPLLELRSSNVGTQAAATTRMPTPQLSRRENRECSAHTLATPKRFPWWRRASCVGNNSPSPKDSCSKIRMSHSSHLAVGFAAKQSGA